MTPLLWLLIMGSAWTGLHAPDQQTSSLQPIPPDLLITLERTGCEGACPMYSLKVLAHGRVIYRGKQFVRTKGKAEVRLTREQLTALLSEFEKVDYFSLRNRYQHWEDGCAGGALDYPSAITSFRINGRVKTIVHDYGCREKSPGGDSRGPVYPRELFALEQKIDEIVGTGRWTR